MLQQESTLEKRLERPIFSADWRRGRGLFRQALSILAFLLAWQLVSMTGLFGRYPRELMGLFLPSPLHLLKTVAEVVANGSLLKHVGFSCYRVVSGFAIATLIGIPAGLLMSYSRSAEQFLNPFVRLFQPIPGVAWVPLAIIWFGLGNKAAVFIITMGAIFPIILSTAQGVRDVDPNLVGAALTLGASKLQVFEKVILPSITPHLVTGFRLAMGFAWRVLLAAEMVGVSSGLGYMLTLGRGTGRTDITLLTMVVIGAIMVAMDSAVFSPLENKTAAWRPRLSKERAEEDEIRG
ncbi:MAG: ABC transporter permease [Bacillota bacterium]